MSRHRTCDKESTLEMLLLYEEHRSYEKVSQLTGVKMTTVRNTILRALDDPEMSEEYEKIKKDFSKRFEEKSEQLIYKLLQAIDDKIDSVIQKKSESKLSEMTTALGTLYDKRALIKGESTDSVKITVQLPEEAKKYAE